MTTPAKQKCIRFDDALEERLVQMAAEENRTFSGQVIYLVRQALAQRAHSRQPSAAA